jgi:hypothetical protein
MKRQPKWVLVGSTLAFSWLAMQIFHEFGHVLGAWATGGDILEVHLPPLGISQTLLSDNPSPLVVAWMGPLIGVAIPLAIWFLVQACKLRGNYVLRFFAGFCCVANGAYLAFGSIHGIGDAGDLVRYGAPSWHLWAFGIILVPLGFYLWNGLSRHFGFGENREAIDPTVTIVVAVGLLLTVVLELALSGVR